jgi:hypothetical protein
MYLVDAPQVRHGVKNAVRGVMQQVQQNHGRRPTYPVGQPGVIQDTEAVVCRGRSD